MVVPNLDDLKGIDFSKKYLNPYDAVYYYNDFTIYNYVDSINLDFNSIRFRQKIIFHGHEYDFGTTSKIFFIHEMSTFDFADRFRGQIPYRKVWGQNLRIFLIWTHLDKVLLIERLIECLGYVLSSYNLDLKYEDLYKLYKDICGDLISSSVYHSVEKMSIEEYDELFQKNNIVLENIENIIDDLNNIRLLNWEEIPIDIHDLKISDKELFPKYHNFPEFRHIYENENSAMINPECLLKEFKFDEELEFKARYIDFLLKFDKKKKTNEYWLNFALERNHIYDAKGYGVFQYKAIVPDLRVVLTKYNLPLYGKKDELIQRIKENLSIEQINQEFKGSIYILTEEGKKFLDENIHYTYMQPLTFTYKEYIKLCENNPHYTPNEILTCLAKVDWITIDNFNWKKYVKQDLNNANPEIIKKFQEYLDKEVYNYNNEDIFVMKFNNPNLPIICPELKKTEIPFVKDYWLVSKVNTGEYNWKYSYHLSDETGELFGISLEDLKQQVNSKKLPWDKSQIIWDLKMNKNKS